MYAIIPPKNSYKSSRQTTEKSSLFPANRTLHFLFRRNAESRQKFSDGSLGLLGWWLTTLSQHRFGFTTYDLVSQTKHLQRKRLKAKYVLRLKLCLLFMLQWALMLLTVSVSVLTSLWSCPVPGYPLGDSPRCSWESTYKFDMIPIFRFYFRLSLNPNHKCTINRLISKSSLRGS